ncbi:regulator of G protein signaling domain-containing protein [Ditylenchus destructor]|nr:regulator of G protein signaling domain-containing protein [Ditylenchus destructor]
MAEASTSAASAVVPVTHAAQPSSSGTASTSGAQKSRQHVLLDKLDEVALKLMDSAHFKTHKYFRVSVPQAITGQNLVQIIQETFVVEDNADAVHLATILLHFGYLFPVIEQSQMVKDDNTLYRLQLPYFWPSHAQQADKVEYAIYLNKRLMRSEQRHGLEEDEIESYNKLAEFLGHIWGFITTQAEMQLKMQKERKKVDKVVFDSEERAFWRQRRPGQSNALEEPYQKLERKLRKTTLQGWRQEVDRLRFSIKTKPWLKAMKASETMVTWCEQFQDYDPFLASSQPSNPWISDDLMLWTLNTDSVEVPTERRVKRWGLSVQELVRDPIGRQVLETFLESEFSSENIRFWMSIQDLKYSPNCQVDAKAQRVHDEFLASGAPCQVNVDSRTLEETFKCLRGSTVSRRHAFSLAEEHIFTLMSKDSYPRFLRSNIYKGVLSAAQQQGTRRLGWRNFVFTMGGGNQKRTPITSKTARQQHEQHKMSRDDNSHTSLPSRQLSSDSLPLKVGQLTSGQAQSGGGTSPTATKESKK